jgi:nucleoid-associated protein YgaU
MSRQYPVRRDLSRSHFSCACTMVMMCALFLFAPLIANAQDVAEAARQEKARKAAQSQKQPPHVYTNDDLKQPQILTPEDRAPVEARKKNSAPPSVTKTPPADAPTQDAAADDSAAPESLGEIARRLRREKAARQTEQARKSLSPAPFQIELPKDATLAHPKPLSPPLVVVMPAPATKSIRPTVGAAAVKRDPFSHNVMSAEPRNSISFGPAPKPAAPLISSSRSVVQPQPSTVPATVRPSPIDSKNRPGTIQAQSGDSLWNLSRRYLGKGSLWREWLSHNPGLGDPRRMQPGAVLLIPPLESRTKYPCDSRTGDSRTGKKPTGTISVQPGDSLWKIAAQHLRKGSEWPCLAHANPELRDASHIYPGQTLVIPSACVMAQAYSTSEAVTSPPSSIPLP